ncbi:MAG: phosphate transport system substrate-binding protein [Halanaerobiales bacterium]|nr:phosphate transport system substrate-binding protein [Halanaerobiales bacterium]
MFKSKVMLVALVALLLSVMSGFVIAGDTLTIQGSTTVLPIAQRAAEVYMQQNPEVNITVRGGGSGNGIAALIDGSVDIANTSRFIKDKEVKAAFANGIYPVPHKVAMDGIAVVVNPVNPVDELTLEDIKAIYTGEITNWKELGGKDQEIVVISRDSSSGTFETFEKLVLDGAKVTPTALLQASNGAVAGVVAETEGAIGYVGLGYLSESLKALKVNGVECTNATVASGKYPIARPLFMFTNGWPKGLTADFINFVLSAEGQKIAEEQGYVPLF